LATVDPIPTAAVADALVKLGETVRVAPANVRRLQPGPPLVGPAVTVRHFGSVDVFLEAFETAPAGGVLVIDNDGRDDEACIGDLTVAEAKLAGLGGIVLWGFHRDEQALREIGLPIWSLGSRSAGPTSARQRVGDPLTEARVGKELVTRSDIVSADDDGVLFVDSQLWPQVSQIAAEIVATEQRQADAIASGVSLREQLGFADFLARRAKDPGYTLRQHLAHRGAAIET
jgi:4-hydroxy-4-methyl-2-oxoglutarate aldolase